MRKHTVLHGFFFLFTLAAPAAFLWAQAAAAQEEQDDDESMELPYKQYVFVKKLKYMPAKGPSGKQTLEFRIDLAPVIPKGTKINFELEYNARSVTNMTYTLKDERRRNLVFTWPLMEKVAFDDYFLRSRIYLEQQTPAVQQFFKGRAKLFPIESKPWPWFLGPVAMGTAEERQQEKQAICALYNDFIGKFVENLTEFKELLDSVKDGKKYVDEAEKLDLEKFTEAIAAWRTKQAEVQRSIAIPGENAALYNKSMTAHRLVAQLGQMVSKQSLRDQEEVLAKYGVKQPINPPVQYFDHLYRFKLSREEMNRKVERILDLVCPEELEAPEEDPPAKSKKKGKRTKGRSKKARP